MIVLDFFKKSKVDLKVSKGSDRTPIFKEIERQYKINPNLPFDVSKIKLRSLEGDGIKFAPGFFNAIGLDDEVEKKDDWRLVLEIIKAVKIGRINNWEVLEHNLKNIKTLPHVDTVLSKLPVSDITPELLKFSSAVCQKSDEEEAIKWCMVFLGLDLKKNYLKTLLILARCSEFTLFASNVIVRATKERPDYNSSLLELLPHTRMWGCIQLIEQILQDKNLADNDHFKEAILIYSMENNDGIPMEIAYTVASEINLIPFFKKAKSNNRILMAIHNIMSTLINDPAPLGGLNDLRDAHSLFKLYFNLLLSVKNDVYKLEAFNDLKVYLNDIETKIDDKEKWRNKVIESYNKIFAPSIIREGLKEKNPWISLKLIQEHNLVELVSDVLILLEKEVNYSVVQTIGLVGNQKHIQKLFHSIPQIINLNHRSKLKKSEVNVSGPEHANNFTYSEIIKYLYKCPTKNILNHLKMAMRDYDPQVRSSAIRSVGNLNPRIVDNEMKKILIEEGKSNLPYLSESARNALNKLTP